MDILILGGNTHLEAKLKDLAKKIKDKGDNVTVLSTDYSALPADSAIQKNLSGVKNILDVNKVKPEANPNLEKTKIFTFQQKNNFKELFEDTDKITFIINKLTTTNQLLPSAVESTNKQNNLIIKILKTIQDKITIESDEQIKKLYESKKLYNPKAAVSTTEEKQKAFFNIFVPEYEKLKDLFNKELKDKTKNLNTPKFVISKTATEKPTVKFKKDHSIDLTANEAAKLMSMKWHFFVYAVEDGDVIPNKNNWEWIVQNFPLVNYDQSVVIGINGNANCIKIKEQVSAKGIIYPNVLNGMSDADIAKMNEKRIKPEKFGYIDHQTGTSDSDWSQFVFISLNSFLSFNQAKASKKPWDKKNEKSGFGYGPKSSNAANSVGGTGAASGDTAAGAGGVGAPAVPTESEEDKRKREEKIIAASTVRINEQAALMINASELLNRIPKDTKGIDSNIGKAVDRYYKNFAVYRSQDGAGGHIDFTKNIFKNQDIAYILKDLPPHILSSLTPAIKIYKVFYPDKKYFSPNSQGFSFRIPFDEIPVKYGKEYNKTSPYVGESHEKELDKILIGDSRFHGIGIKSFRYKYVGTNPAEVNTNIEADLEIYMQDVRDIVKEFNISNMMDNFIDIDGEDKTKFEKLKFSYCDLVADVPAKNKEQYNNDYYRIKIMVGYSIPPYHYLYNLLGNEATPEKVNKIIDSLKKATVFLYLNPYNHDLTFEDNGSITLKIKYNAAMTTQTSMLNCLEIAENSYEKIKIASKEYEQKSKEKTDKSKTINLNCYGFSKKELDSLKQKNEDYYKQELETLKTNLEMNKNSLYTEIFSRLTGVRKSKNPESPTGRVFLATFDSEALGLTKTGELADTSSSKAYYTNIGQLKKVHDYELTSLDRNDPSWFLTEPPETPPNPNNAEKQENSDDKKEDDKKEKTNYDKAVEEAKNLGYKKINNKTLEKIAKKYKLIDVKATKATKNKKEVKENLEKTKFIKELTLWVKEEAKKNIEDPNKKNKDKKDKDKKDKDKEDKKDTNEPNKDAKPDEAASKKAAEALSEKNDKTANSTLAPMTGIYEGKFGVKFVFLGDIFDIFCEILTNIDYNEERPKIVLNEFSIEVPESYSAGSIKYKQQKFNLADVPISVNMLRHFLMERMVKPRRSSYNLFTLLTNILTDIMSAALSPRYFGTKSILNRAVRMSMLGVSIPQRPSGNESLLGTLKTSKRFGGTITTAKLTKANISELITIDNNKNLNNYLILYSSNQLPDLIKKSNGSIKTDEENGIYHFYIGANKGMVKGIKFTRTNTPYYKEMKNASSHGLSSLGRLQEVYDVSVNMFGNNIYKPGDFIYIESLFFTDKTAVDLQQKIGLGGYYQIIDVETRLESGNYETKLSAVLFGRITGGVVESLVDERACGVDNVTTAIIPTDVVRQEIEKVYGDSPQKNPQN